MNLENLNFSEEPLSREYLLRIKCGKSAMYTVYATGDSNVTNGDPHQPNLSDVVKD